MEQAIRITEAIAGAASTLVAVAALYVAFRGERRNELRFDEQLKEAREIATANMKPLLTIRSQTYVNRKGISLVNSGVGTAVITEVHFERGDRRSSDLVELFDLEVVWDTFWRFSGSIDYLPAGEKRQLIELSESEAASRQLLEEWQRQKSGIKVRVEYSDLLGNSLEPYIDTLK